MRAKGRRGEREKGRKDPRVRMSNLGSLSHHGLDSLKHGKRLPVGIGLALFT